MIAEQINQIVYALVLNLSTELPHKVSVLYPVCSELPIKDAQAVSNVRRLCAPQAQLVEHFVALCDSDPEIQAYAQKHWDTLVDRMSRAMPDAKRLALNFAKASFEESWAILRGEKMLTDEEAAERFAVCDNTCRQSMGGHLTENERCDLCGCFMRKKAKWRSQVCPAGKW